jgi:hypothetical protein
MDFITVTIFGSLQSSSKLRCISSTYSILYRILDHTPCEGFSFRKVYLEMEVFNKEQLSREEVFCAQEYNCNSVLTNQINAGDSCKARE